MATTGSATPAGPPGCGDKAEGLKTQISAALSGLLDRALSSQAEQAVAHQTPGPAVVQTAALAREVRRLIMGPTPARLVLLRAAERAAGKEAPEPYPYSCLYCDCGFEHEKTRNRHMGHAHKREMYGRPSKQEESDDDLDDGEDSDCKSKPPMMGSPASEYPVESDGQPVTTGAGVAGGSSESVVGAPADSTRMPVRLNCGELPASDEAAVTHVAEEPEASGPPAVQTSALARELHRLIRAPAPARLVLQRASERAAGVDGPDPYPFPCLYCESRFEQQSTCNRHMGRAHRTMILPDLKWEELEDDPGGVSGDEASDESWQEPKVSIWTPETPGGDVGAEGDFLCSEPKPPVMGSPASACPVDSDGQPVTTGAGAADGPSGSIAATTDSVAGTPPDSPCTPAPLHCGELSAGEEAVVTHVAEEPEASESGRGDEALGLKTHISTAFGGLLERAVTSRLEKRLGPSGLSLAAIIPLPQRGRRRAPASTPAPSSGGRWRRIYATDLAKRVRQHLSEQPRTMLPVRRCAADTAQQCEPSRYTCLYCDRRFDSQMNQKRHMETVHRNEIISSTLKEAEPEGNSDDELADKDDDCGWQEPKVSIWTPETPGGDVGAEGDFLCSESKPPVTGSPASACPVDSDGQPVTTSAVVVGGLSGSVAAATDSVADTPADSPGTSASLDCGKLPAGEEAAVTHVAEEPEASESDCGGEAQGLKTHISTAFGGLLERAVSSRLEKTLVSSGLSLAAVIPRPERGRRRAPASTPSLSHRGRRRRIYATDLAKRVRQHLSGQPRSTPPARRCAADTAQQCEPSRYSCLYCDRRFDLRTCLQWHMKTVHSNEIISSTLKEAEPEDNSDDELTDKDDYCESKPLVEGCPVSERSGVRSDAGGAAVAVAGSSPPPRAAATSPDPPRVPPHPKCHDLPSRRDAPPALVADEHSDSAPVTDPTAATGSPGRRTRSMGLKTHIWRALGGLMERAASSWLEKGGSARLPGPPGPERPPSETATATATAAGDCSSHRYACFYCEKRFNNLGSHMWHMKLEHKDKMIDSELKQTEHEDEAMDSEVKQEQPGDDVSASGDCDGGWREQNPTNCTSETPGGDTGCNGDYLCSDCGVTFGTLQELLVHEKEEQEAAAAQGEEAAGWQVETSPLKSPEPETETIFIKEETPAEMGPLASPQPEIEAIFIKEETAEWESSDDLTTARDPLSMEDEVQEDPVVVSGYSDCIKEEPDVDLAMDSSDSTEVVARGHTSDITRIANPTSTWLSLSEVGSTGQTVPVSSHFDGGHRDDDTSASGTDTVTSLDDTGTPAYPFSDVETDRENTIAGNAAGSDGTADTKPPYCYAELIAMALENSPNRQAKVSEICAYILNRFPYYRNRKAWQKSIRVNLSLHKCFVKVPCEGRIRNNYWMVDPKYEAMFENGNYRRRSKQSVLSDAEAVCRPHYVLDSGHRLQHLRADSQLPVDTTAPSQSRQSVLRADDEDSGGDVSSGDGTVLPFSSPHHTRSSPIYDGNNSASCEERDLQSAVHDEVVTEQEKSTRGILSREDNPIRSADNMSTKDSDFPAFTCSSCLQSFSSKYSLIMHVFTHLDRVEPPSHVCRHCGEVFVSDDGLNEHLKMRGSGRTLTADTGKVCTSPVNKKPYKCNACSKSFAFNCYLQKRADMDYGIKPHECEICGKLFSRVNDLKVHLLVHSGLKSLNCDVCDKLFATVDELKSHSAVHCEVNSHKCNICGKSFATQASLKSHIVEHSVVESHKCDDCGKLFARVGKFELLLSVHSGPKSRKCSVCSKPFKSAFNLRRHMQQVHATYTSTS